MKYGEKIENEIGRIIDELSLVSNPNETETIINAVKLHRYLADYIDFSMNIVEEKKYYRETTAIENELNNALIKKTGVCTTASIAYKEILSRLGMKVLIVGSLSKMSEERHLSNLVLIGNYYYYFDVTTENGLNEDKGDYNCLMAGLGSEAYEIMFSPKVILPDSMSSGLMPLPLNIAKTDLDFSIINTKENKNL